MVILPAHSPRHINSPNRCQALTAWSSCLSSGFQHAQGRPKGPIWMQFKIHSSASFPASQLHSLTCCPSSPVPIPYSTAALLAYAPCFPLIAFCTSSLCPYWLCFCRQCIYCELANASTWTYIQLSLNNFHLLWFCFFSFSVSLNTACIFSELFQLQYCLLLFSLVFFFVVVLSFFFLSHFPCFHYASLLNSGDYFSTAALSVHLHWEGSEFNLSVLNAPFSWEEINGSGRLGFYLLPHTKMSFFLMYSNLPLPCGFTPTCFSIKTWLKLYFHANGVHCGDDMGHFCFLFRWRCGFDLQIGSQVCNLPWELACTQSCCFPLLVLPSLWLVHDCIWTNSFMTWETFWFDIHKEMRYCKKEKLFYCPSVKSTRLDDFVEDSLWSKFSGAGK